MSERTLEKFLERTINSDISEINSTLKSLQTGQAELVANTRSFSERLGRCEKDINGLDQRMWAVIILFVTALIGSLASGLLKLG